MFQVFRNDRDKRDFVSGGAAAGVAAAFGSPTGGIMFALEEASSFWSLSLTWKSYLCTMLSTSTLWMLLAARDDSQSYRGLVTFGAPDDCEDEGHDQVDGQRVGGKTRVVAGVVLRLVKQRGRVHVFAV